ncbi:ankyrin repeat and SOCS box protein 3 [Hyperolius riggenbachi]|uniref:ankyrin repeat and SOCS box protein 3 n=1 Tax=Hyperolius riggenbachi TaxID=752182 RepID=UPI0035A33731
MAVERGSVEVVRLLLKYKVNVNGAHSCSGWNPLHQAALMERTDLMQLLLESGVDKECVDDFGITPLFIAAQYGRYDSLSLLLSNGADVNCQAKDKATPLFIAAQEGHEKCAELLLSAGADPNRFCNEEAWQLPVHAAAQMGRPKILETLITVTDRACDQGRGHISPVYSAVYGGHKECLELLLARGYSPEAQECPLFGCRSPLCMAIQRGHSDLAPLLLRYGLKLSSLYLGTCLEYNNFPLFRYFLSQRCPLPSGEELDAFKQQSSNSGHKEWLPDLLLAGLDPERLLDAAWIRSVDDDMLNFALEFTNWKRLSADVELLLSSRAEHLTWTPHKHLLCIPPLMHLCRLKIRSLLKTERLRSSDSISQLPLPVCLQEYLQYSDMLRHYGIAREEASPKNGEEAITQSQGEEEAITQSQQNTEEAVTQSQQDEVEAITQSQQDEVEAITQSQQNAEEAVTQSQDEAEAVTQSQQNAEEAVTQSQDEAEAVTESQQDDMQAITLAGD